MHAQRAKSLMIYM
jgi:pyridoxal phosphate enzyme (YggS family)